MANERGERMAHGAPSVAFAEFVGEWPAWRAQGACVGSGIDFYDETPEGLAASRRVCRECPVRAECQTFGMAQAIGHSAAVTFGVWGGQLVRGGTLRSDPNSRTSKATPDVIAWHAEGVNNSEIARRVHLDPKVIRRILANEGAI